MGKIMDFRCTYDNAGGLGEWAGELDGISFPQVYTEQDSMAELAKRVREHNGAKFCQLPFCHTLEAEALGGQIRLGNAVTGPRAGGYSYRSLEEILEVPEISPESASGVRLKHTLAACEKLKAQGKPVLFLVTGPFTILNGLVDSGVVFRAALKKPKLLLAVFHKLKKDILKVMKLAEASGVRYLSYADPSGGVNIIGPKLAEWTAKEFTVKLLKEADQHLSSETMVLLCPKTAFALLGTELAEWREHKLPYEMEYLEAVRYLKEMSSGKANETNMLDGVRFSGQDCINRIGHKLSGGFQELILSDNCETVVFQNSIMGND